MKSTSIFSNKIFLIFFSSVVAISLSILLYSINQLETRFEDNMLDIATKDIMAITKNTSRSIQNTLSTSANCIQHIINNPDVQEDIDIKLTTLVTKNIKYVYLLYRDKQGTFRFLADGAKGDEKAFLNQKFDIQNSEWLEIYKSKKPLLLQQPLLNQLSITYLVPLVRNNEVRMILAIDFSVDKTEDINKVISFVKNIIISIIFIICIFTLILTIQMFKYFRVKKTAYIDKLTEVYNRNYLHEIEDTINLDEYVLAALDIDYFKKINDTYGHDVGDIILKDIAKTILLSIRSHEDIIIRYGGEEFIILSKKQDGQRENSLNVIKRVFKNIQEKKFLISNGNYLYVTVSIGINLHPAESRNFKDAFKLADIALYKAKENGRNQMEIYEEQ